MLKVRAQLQGYGKVVGKLMEIESSIKGPLLRMAGQDAAAVVEEEINKRVPVLTGLLQLSMDAAVGTESSGLVRIWIGPRDDMAKPGYGDPAVYGEVIEKIGSPAGRGRRFMMESARAAAPRVIRIVSDAIRDIVLGHG